MSSVAPSVANFSIASQYIIGAQPEAYIQSYPTTGSAVKRFSWTVPTGSSLIGATLTHSVSGDGGTRTVNGVIRADSMDMTAAVLAAWVNGYVDLTYRFTCIANVELPTGVKTETAYFNNNVLTITYSDPVVPPPPDPLQPVVSNVRVDGLTGDRFYNAGSVSTLAWDILDFADNRVTSYTVFQSTVGGGMVVYASGLSSPTCMIPTPSAGSNQRYLIVALAPLSNSHDAYSGYLYSRSMVGVPANVRVSSDTKSPNESVTLSWDLASGGVGTTVVSYIVYENGVAKTSVSGGSYTFAAPGVGSYAYKVIAVADTYGYNSALSDGASLSVIPPASNFVLNKSKVAMDDISTIVATITPSSSAYNHDVTFAIDATRTSTANVAEGSTTRTFTVPLSWCVGVPNATSKVGTCTVVTKNGSTVIGETSLTFTVTVPASVVPTASLVVTPLNSFNGMYLKGISKARLTSTDAGAQGSTISSRSLYGGGYSGSSNPFDTGVLNTIGSNTMTVVVTDSRNRRATDTEAITVFDYNPPLISNVFAFRSDITGNLLDSGEYIAVIADLSVTAIAGNSGSATIRKRVPGGEWGASVAITHDTTVVLSGALQENAYEVEITYTDTVGTVSTYSTVVRPAKFMYDFRMDRAGIGRLAGSANTFILPDDWTTNIKLGDITGDGKVGSTANLPLFTGTGGLVSAISVATARNTLGLGNTSGALPVANGGTGVTTDKEIALKSYPVGAIYMSIVSTSPATLFGGTWAAIAADKFLRTITSGTAGGTGGSDTHTQGLSAGFAKAHQASGNASMKWALKSGSYTAEYATEHAAAPVGDNTAMTVGIALGGSTDSGDNVPSYYTVYAWRRTA